MESDKVVIVKSRGPRRVGLKRSSIQGISVLPTVDPPTEATDSSTGNGNSDEKGTNDLNDSDSNNKDHPATIDTGLTDAVVPMEVDKSDAPPNNTSTNPTLDESDTTVTTEPVNAETDSSTNKNESSGENREIVSDNGDSGSTLITKEEPTNDVNSEDSDEFLGFQSPPSPETKPILTKLIATAQLEIDEAEKSLLDNMDGNLATPTDEPKVETKEAKIGNGVGKKKKKKDAAGGFDNIKLLSDVSSEVTSSNDVLNNTNDSYKGSDEVVSEVTSSATNSPSLGSGGIKSPASATRPKRGARMQKSTVDISDPIFRKPFEFGWKRELVYRNSNDSSTKVQADIYYYAPSGKKVRSTREIMEHLFGTELTIENFTFWKEPLGVEDTEKEIIRIAKRVSSIGGGPVPSPKRLSTPKTSKTAKDPLANSSPKVSPDSPEKAGTSKGTTRGFPRIKITPSQLMRSSPSAAKGKGRGKKGQAAGGELVMGTLPPNWTQSSTAADEPEAPATAASPGKKRKRESDAAADVAAVKRAKKAAAAANTVATGVTWPLSFPSLLATGYTAMLSVFQYLKVKELLRAARVCKLWRDLADHPSLWRVVRMKNSQVDDWEGFVTSLVRHDTQQLDLRKMLLPTEQADIDTLWRSFLKEISRATGLVRIDLCRCPAYVVEELATACPGLTVLNAVAIKCSAINLDSLANLTNLQELRLKSMTGCHLTSNMDAFKSLTTLKHLSLTTFKDLGQAGPEVLGLLTNLESLEIGECSDLDEDFSIKVLSNLRKMTSLRFEKGQGKTCPTFSLLAGVKELPALTQLELVNFDIKAGFSEALAQCTNIKRLLIIPTYVTQSATTNHMVLSAVTELKDTLSHLVWGVTNELLRVTELFIDQCDTAKDGANKNKAPKVPKSPDSIPIMKPESCKNDWDSSDSKSMSSPIGQVKILTLAKLQQVLVTQLPNTKIKILKVPFQSTWRQSISEPMT